MTMEPETSTSIPAVMTQALRGFCIGVADIVPGVSGGTIALALGIYNRLLINIRAGAGAIGRLLKLDLHGFMRNIKAIEWGFILPLLGGAVIAALTLAHWINKLLLNYPEPMAGLFLGLIAASIYIGQKLVSSWKTDTYTTFVLVAVGSFLLLGFQSETIRSPSSIQFLCAGAIAICAMILPGVSGSFLLLILGMYVPLLHAVNEREIPSLAFFGAGATVGLILFSTLLSWLLKNYADRMLAALLGLMVGSIRVLWPWPRGLGIISDDERQIVNGTDLGWPNNFNEFFWPSTLTVLAFVAITSLAFCAESRATSPAEPVPTNTNIKPEAD